MNDLDKLAKIAAPFALGPERLSELRDWLRASRPEDTCRLIYELADLLNRGELPPTRASGDLRAGWDNPVYAEPRRVIEEQDAFLVTPFEVEEGVLECKKCGSKRVFSYSKQVRSCDEGTSVFATCVECQTAWVHTG